MQVGNRFRNDLFPLRVIRLLPLDHVTGQVKVERVVQSLAITAGHDVMTFNAVIEPLLCDIE